MVVVGLAAAVLAVLLYAGSTVLQACVARSATDTPTLRTLVRSRTWSLAIGMLVLAFLFFAASTRTLSLPLAEVLRSSYLVVAAVLSHAVFGTRPAHREYLGVLLAAAGLGLLAGFGGEKGAGAPPAGLAVTMAAVLVAAVAAAKVVEQVDPRRPVAGIWQAALAGVSFAVLDMGVRSVPHPLSVSDTLSTAACWVGAFGAPAGLLLFARAVALTTVTVANTLLLTVDVVLASVWAGATFHDSLRVPLAGLIVGAVAMAVGVLLVVRPTPAAASPPRPDAGSAA